MSKAKEKLSEAERSEIVKNILNAKDKRLQLKIEADLHLTSVTTIKEILKERGFIEQVTDEEAVRKMLGEEMEWEPANFIFEKKYLESYKEAKNGCVYRTLNREKFIEVCQRIHLALTKYITEKEVYIEDLTLEKMFEHNSIEEIIAILCEWLAPARLGKAGVSACKRICMYLRWMVRTGEPDLGLWSNKKASQLYAVMDVHVCKLTASIISRKQADWKACTELTNIFRSWDKTDPLKYDIALMTIADNGF